MFVKCRMRDVLNPFSEAEPRFCRLSMGIQTFARFVPEAVVRNIIKGQEIKRKKVFECHR